MIKIPNYIFCFTKFVSFFGLDYEAPSIEKKAKAVKEPKEQGDKKSCTRNTKKNRLKERRTFDAQAQLHLQYVDKAREMLAKRNERKKQEAIKSYFIMSEHLVRFLTSKNYYTIASDKRASWALLAFFYIPHIACIMESHQKKFGLPHELIEHDFMFPYRDLKSGAVITPNKRFYKYCNYFMQYINKEEGSSILKFLYYLNELNKKSTIPSFDKKRQILQKIAEVDLFRPKIPEVDKLIHATIVSGNIYHDLSKAFGETYALQLFDYYKVCLKIRERHLNDHFIGGDAFRDYLSKYMDFYDVDKVYTLKLLNPKNEKESDFDTVKALREESLQDLFDHFDAFLHATNIENQDQLDVLNIDEKEGIFSDYSHNKLELDHENLISILKQLEDIFTCYWKPSWDALDEAHVSKLLQSLKANKFYSHYECEHLYYSALSDFAENEFKSAYDKLLALDKKISDSNAGDTWHDIAIHLIILKLLSTKSEVQFSHLNPLIKSWIEAQSDQSFYRYYLDKPKEKNNQNYFDEIHRIMSDFNRRGYARYKGQPCVKYTPYQKLDDFIGDLYEFDEQINADAKIGEVLVKPALEKLMLGGKPKYGINSYFVALFEFKAVDVFEPQHFKTAVSFYERSGMQSKNIAKLAQDEQKLNSIYEAIKEMSKPTENKQIS